MDEDYVRITDVYALKPGDRVFYLNGGKRNYGIIPTPEQLSRWTGPQGPNIVVCYWGGRERLGYNYINHDHYPTYLEKRAAEVVGGTKWRYTSERMSYDLVTTRAELLRTEHILKDLGTLIITEQGTIREL